MISTDTILAQRIADLRRDARRCIALAVHVNATAISRDFIDEAVRLFQRIRTLSPG